MRSRSIDGAAKPAFERGRAFYYQRHGQMNVSCAQCHEHNWGKRLLRETGVAAGLMITDKDIRLVYAPKCETSGWFAFPIRSLATVGGRAMLGGLKLMLSAPFKYGQQHCCKGLLYGRQALLSLASAAHQTQHHHKQVDKVEI